MAEPYLSEIRIVGFNFAPRGWSFCDGQILPINQNQSLYSLLGTTYGGDGRTTFGLPDLRGRAPMHFEGSFSGPYSFGRKGGEESHALNAAEIPAHGHTLQGSTNAASTDTPGTTVVLATTPTPLYAPGAGGAPGANTVANQGSNQPHPNMQPYQVVSFCIAITGVFPSRN